MPYLYHYKGYDRATPDNGFPRRWNLYNHIKRVHAWTPPESEASFYDEPPASSQPRPDKKNDGEKRKKIAKPGSHVMKKSRST